MKRVLVVSDLHGEGGLERLRDVVYKEGPVDILFCCGDLEVPTHDIWVAADGAQCFMVRGNCDYGTRLPAEEEINVEGLRFWMVHGDRYGVRYTTDALFETGNERRVNVVLFGHTHVPLLEDCRKETAGRGSVLYIVNPGSLGRPYQKGRKPAYSVMEVDGTDISVAMKTLDI